MQCNQLLVAAIPLNMLCGDDLVNAVLSVVLHNPVSPDRQLLGFHSCSFKLSAPCRQPDGSKQHYTGSEWLCLLNSSTEMMNSSTDSYHGGHSYVQTATRKYIALRSGVVHTEHTRQVQKGKHHVLALALNHLLAPQLRE